MSGGAPSPHRHAVRVYHEDTDASGVVYHAGYLRFCERGRSEWLRDLGLDQRALLEAGLAFAVSAMEARWRAPARLGEALIVDTRLGPLSGARLVLDQAVAREGAALFEARVTIVAMGPAGRPMRLPRALRAALGGQGGARAPA